MTQSRAENLKFLGELFKLFKHLKYSEIERSLNDKQSRDCMLVNSALELAPHDPELRDLVRQELQQIQQFFRRCVLKGRRLGRSRRRNPRTIWRNYVGRVIGIRVLARTAPTRELLQGAAQPALCLFDAPGID